MSDKCKNCGERVVNETDDNYNGDHTAWKCPYCQKWSNVQDASASDYVPPLVHLPGSRLTPEVVLHRTLNKISRIKGVAIVIQWDDDTFATDWSQMPIAALCMASYSLQSDAHDVMTGREPAM